MENRSDCIYFRKFISFIVLTCLLVVLTVCGGSDTYGPYDFVLREIGTCSEEIVTTNQLQFDMLKPRRTNGGISFSGNTTFLIPISNDIVDVVDLSKFGNGGWKSHFFQTELQNACDRITNILPEIKEGFKKLFNAECPIPPGVHDWTGFRFPRTFKNIPSYHYGKYMMENKFMLNNEIVGCFTFSYDVLPKIKPKGRQG